MRKLFAVLSVLVVLSLVLSACGTQAPAGTVNNATAIAATVQAMVSPTPTKDVVADGVSATLTAMAPASNEEPTNAPSLTPTTTPKSVTSVQATKTPVAQFPKNSLVNPVLFDAGEDPAGEADPGLFDIGVNDDQIGIVFGWDLSWDENSIEGEGCEMAVLNPGWYEDFQILDGRYEIYTLPSKDPAGWREVLIQQRVAEQAKHYGCSANAVPPVWEGGE